MEVRTEFCYVYRKIEVTTKVIHWDNGEGWLRKVVPNKRFVV